MVLSRIDTSISITNIFLVPIIPEFLYDIQHPDQPLTATFSPIAPKDYPVPHGDMTGNSSMLVLTIIFNV